MHYEIRYDMIAILVLGMMIFVDLLFTKFPTRVNKSYVHLAGIMIVSILLNIISAFANDFLGQDLLWLKNIISIFHLIFVNILPVVYFRFICLVARDEQITFSKRSLLLQYVTVGIDIILIASSPFTHLIMYYDADGAYCHGPLMMGLYAVTVAYMVGSVIYLYIHKQIIRPEQIIVVLFYTFATIVAMVIQFFIPTMLIIGLVSAFSILLFYFTLRNPLEFTYDDIGTFNRSAFKEYFFSRGELKNQAAMMIYMPNLESLKELYGTDNTHYIMKQYVKKASRLTGAKFFFYLFHNCLVVIFKDQQEAEEMARKLMEQEEIPLYPSPESESRIQNPISMEFYILPDISLLPEEELTVKGDSHFDTLLNILLYAQKIPGSQGITYIDEKIIHEYTRNNMVQERIIDAISKKSFEVLLQPIYDIKKKKFNGAESLIRARDLDGRYISPTKFITQAERTGHILAIGDIAFEKTFEYINSGRLREIGIEKVNINLSMVQCMQDNIVEHILSIINRYEIPCDMLRFEITESLVENDPIRLANIMEAFCREGIEFAMDDYGTGYSNTTRLMNFPFNEVKFDKSFVDAAAIDQQKAIPLKHLMSMAKDFSKTVLVEGVETEEMADLMEEYQADLIQGYFYSKPLEFDDFVAFIKENNRTDGETF